MRTAAHALSDLTRPRALRRVGLLAATAVAATGIVTSGLPGASPFAAPPELPAGLQVQHVDQAPSGVDVTDPLSVRELYDASGLGTPADARAAAGNVADGSVTPAGAPTTSGLAQHVSRSCTGDGSDGSRVKVLYVRTADQPDRFASVRTVIENEIANVDDVFALSAQKGGDGRRVRWVHDAGCAPVIDPVVLPVGSLDTSYNPTISALVAAGYSSPNRKYLAFSDGNALCGVGTMYRDSSPTSNLNDHRTGYARVDQACWSRNDHSTPAHELMHTLGSVNNDAPNASANGHCVDDADLMCYADAPGVTTRSVCPGDQEALFDCGNDDYFSTAQVPASYLQTHWNVASSAFLDTVSASPAPATSARSVFVGSTKVGYPTQLSALLRDSASGRPVPAQAVSLHVTWQGAKTWSAVASTLRTDAHGRVSVRIKPTRAGRYQFVYTGSAGVRAAATKALLVKIPTKISLALRHGPTRIVGKIATGAGRALPASVRLQYRPQGATIWRTLRKVSSDRSGRLAANMAPKRATSYRWSYVASATHAPARSRQLRVGG